MRRSASRQLEPVPELAAPLRDGKSWTRRRGRAWSTKNKAALLRVCAKLAACENVEKIGCRLRQNLAAITTPTTRGLLCDVIYEHVPSLSFQNVWVIVRIMDGDDAHTPPRGSCTLRAHRYRQKHITSYCTTHHLSPTAHFITRWPRCSCKRERGDTLNACFSFGFAAPHA